MADESSGAVAGPLAGIRVVDLSRVAAGPICAMTLGDLGADVIKVEPAPDGDLIRSQQPEFTAGVGSYFATVNRNKRSLMIDLRSPGGQKALRALVSRADVLVENFRPGVLEAMGLDEETIAREYPNLIAARIAAYGHHGPKSHLPGVDQIVQGVSGFMSVTGTEESGPMRAGIAICDIYAGLSAAIGVLGALYERRTSGRGQMVRTSLLQAMLSMMTVQAGKYMATDQAPPPEGNHHPIVAPYGLFPTADGHIVLNAMRDHHFRAFAELCGHPEWADDERFATARERSLNKDTLRDLALAATPSRTTEEWLRLLTEADIHCGPVLSVKDAFEDAQSEALGMTLHATLGDGTEIRLPGHAATLSRTPMAMAAPPPLAGEHSAEILNELELLGDDEVRAAAGLD